MRIVSVVTASILGILLLGCYPDYCQLYYSDFHPDLGVVVDRDYKFTREEAVAISKVLAYYGVDFKMDTVANELFVRPEVCKDDEVIANYIMKSKDSSWIMEHLQEYPENYPFVPGR